MKYVRIITLGMFGLMLAAWLMSSAIAGREGDKEKPVITADEDRIQLSVEDGVKGLMKGMKASDHKDGDLTDKIIIGKYSKFLEKGVCKVTFLVFDSHNNVGEYTREVEYTDYESPKFALSRPLVYKLGEKVTVLDRLTVSDSIEGDISDKIKIVSSNVNVSGTGTYAIGVEAVNSFGDVVSAELPVNIVKSDESAPVIQLNRYLLSVKAGDVISPESYIKGVELRQGTMSDLDNVHIDVQIDTSEPGAGQIVYSYTDDEGVTGYTSLTVVVEEGE